VPLTIIPRSLLFCPSITFGLLKAEIFPWATIYALAKLRSVSRALVVLVLIMLVSVLAAIYSHGPTLLPETARSLVAYTNPIILMLVLAVVPHTELRRLTLVFKVVFAGLLTIGLLQKSGLLQPFDALFKALVPRGLADEVGEGRGVALLSSEPSRAAMEVLFLYAAWRSAVHCSAIRALVTDLLLAVFVVAVLKSALGLALLLIYFGLLYRWRLLLALAIFGPLVVSLSGESRAVTVALQIAATSSASELFTLLINASGFRLVSILSAYNYALETFWGGGVGAWAISSINAMEAAGFSANEINHFIFHYDSEFVGVRPTSYMSNVALDMGIPGLIAMLLFLRPYLRRAWSCGAELRPLLGLFLFSLLFIGAVGNPVPWLALMLAVRWSEHRSHVLMLRNAELAAAEQTQRGQ
jgi:hypothetical protein